MGKTYKEQLALAAEIKAVLPKITVGASYAHYKSDDKIYEVIGLGFLEATDELCVIYQTRYGERLTFIRPLSVWLEKVKWQGQTVPRFTKLN